MALNQQRGRGDQSVLYRCTFEDDPDKPPLLLCIHMFHNLSEYSYMGVTTVNTCQ
jgi:hypothetical protein